MRERIHTAVTVSGHFCIVITELSKVSKAFFGGNFTSLYREVEEVLEKRGVHAGEMCGERNNKGKLRKNTYHQLGTGRCQQATEGHRKKHTNNCPHVFASEAKKEREGRGFNEVDRGEKINDMQKRSVTTNHFFSFFFFSESAHCISILSVLFRFFHTSPPIGHGSLFTLLQWSEGPWRWFEGGGEPLLRTPCHFLQALSLGGDDREAKGKTRKIIRDVIGDSSSIDDV